MTAAMEPPHDQAIRDMDAASETIAACRLDASRYRQMGLGVLAGWCLANAKAAERWLVRAAKAYPERCGP